MLTKEELEEIEEELKHMPSRQSGSIDAFKIVQKHRSWVSDEAIADLAPVLSMTPAELDRVATFYNLIFRQPVGKHIILVCDSISCYLTGETDLFQHLTTRLGIQPGQTTTDGQFTLLPTVCLGHCDQAPVMMLDWKIIGNLTIEKLDQILDDIVKKESA